MGLTTELIIFDTTEEYRNNQEIIAPGYDVVLKSKGAHSPGYYGIQYEDPSTGYVFLNWDSYEAHKAVQDGPTFTEIAEKLQPCLGGKMEFYHIQFSGPTTAFDKPVTSVLIFTLKAPENIGIVLDILSEVSKGYELVYGQTRENENKWVVINGWSSVEEHFEHASRPNMTAAVGRLATYATTEHLFHIKLKQHRL